MAVELRRRPRELSCEGLPNRLRRYRLERGMTLRAVAEYLGVTPQAVKQAETKGTGIHRSKWYRLADLFDVDPRILETPEILSEKYQVST